MFDEPLTVIDPHLKWQLRSQLKELHQRIARTMIYVTHDQTEALTFADQVVVMHDSAVVQVGTPVDLFARPRHTFVGHFIGSPGMNVLPCDVERGAVTLAGQVITVENSPVADLDGKRTEIGVRPEFVSFAKDGVPVEVVKVSDAGRYQIVETRHGEHRINVLVADGDVVPGEGARLSFDPAQTRLYADGWLVE
jgi:glycerol transport system ATP-binding protein